MMISILGSVDSPRVDTGVNIVDHLTPADAATVYEVCQFLSQWLCDLDHNFLVLFV